jgi:hypothetical protein
LETFQLFKELVSLAHTLALKTEEPSSLLSDKRAGGPSQPFAGKARQLSTVPMKVLLAGQRHVRHKEDVSGDISDYPV